MKFSKIIFLTIVSGSIGFLLIGDCKKPLPHNQRLICAESGLRIRTEPNLKSKRIGLIPYKTKILLLEEKKETVTILKTPGKWTRVDWKGKKGWVFGGFLCKKIEAQKK